MNDELDLCSERAKINSTEHQRFQEINSTEHQRFQEINSTKHQRFQAQNLTLYIYN